MTGVTATILFRNDKDCYALNQAYQRVLGISARSQQPKIRAAPTVFFAFILLILRFPC